MTIGKLLAMIHRDRPGYQVPQALRDLDRAMQFVVNDQQESAVLTKARETLLTNAGQPSTAGLISTSHPRQDCAQEPTVSQAGRRRSLEFGGLLLSMRRASSVISEFDRWPPGEQPTGAGVFAHNERIVPAPPERVWNLLVDAQGWSEFYDNAHFVELSNPRQHQLRRGSVFRWVTFGFPTTSEVDICHRPIRIGWRWWRRGAHGYHIWLLEPHEHGTRIVTEETQRGVLPGLMRPIMPPLLWFGHNYWLRQLSRQASRQASRGEAFQ